MKEKKKPIFTWYMRYKIKEWFTWSFLRGLIRGFIGAVCLFIGFKILLPLLSFWNKYDFQGMVNVIPEEQRIFGFLFLSFVGLYIANLFINTGARFITEE